MESKKIITHDHLTASPLNLLANTLNDQTVPYRHAVLPTPDTEIPPTWHHVYFPPRTPEDELALDGYETDFFPPPPFVQRMWAGATLSWNTENPLRIGQQATMSTTLDKAEYQQGRMGESVFVHLGKNISNDQGWSMKEERSLVYLGDQSLSLGPIRTIRANKKPTFSRTMTPSSILLFRYSALTFNSHKIHFDHTYATTQEHHPACLVHGPLSSTLLMGLLRSHIQALDSKVKLFRYKCLLPLYVHQPLTLCGRESALDPKSYELWIVNHDGHLAVKGSVELT
ncbi:hypothetical protein CLU79DRAFT_78749 [Phycomyces nitens]|nr:hypothetical protein CLU79DRAFT_78749 [Phycomyces nitens]